MKRDVVVFTAKSLPAFDLTGEHSYIPVVPSNGIYAELRQAAGYFGMLTSVLTALRISISLFDRNAFRRPRFKKGRMCGTSFAHIPENIQLKQ
jgi:hypothetical protein